MTEPISFTIWGIPEPKGSTRAFIPKGWTRPVITSTNKGLKEWETLVRIEAQKYVTERYPFEGPISVSYIFSLPRPKNLPKRIRFPTKRPDLDKLIRSLNDALSGVFFRDDSQIVEIMSQKEYGKPSVRVLVEFL